MEEKDYQELERLLLKLEKELNSRYCILPYINDCWAIATYTRGGDLKKQHLGVSIEDAVKKHKSEMKPTQSNRYRNKVR